MCEDGRDHVLLTSCRNLDDDERRLVDCVHALAPKCTIYGKETMNWKLRKEPATTGPKRTDPLTPVNAASGRQIQLRRFLTTTRFDTHLLL